MTDRQLANPNDQTVTQLDNDSEAISPDSRQAIGLIVNCNDPVDNCIEPDRPRPSQTDQAPAQAQAQARRTQPRRPSQTGGRTDPGNGPMAQLCDPAQPTDNADPIVIIIVIVNCY